MYAGRGNAGSRGRRSREEADDERKAAEALGGTTGEKCQCHDETRTVGSYHTLLRCGTKESFAPNTLVFPGAHDVLSELSVAVLNTFINLLTVPNPPDSSQWPSTLSSLKIAASIRTEHVQDQRVCDTC